MGRLLFLLLAFTLPVGLHAQQMKAAVIGGKRYIGHLDPFGFSLHNSKGATVLSLTQQSYFDFKFQDFNHDGFKDLYLDLGGNTPEKYILYLFVPSKSKFEEIKGFSSLPDAKLIKGTKYYYSYSRGGCADNSWNSSLFSIKNNTAIRIASMYAEGCGLKNGIYIYKVRAGEKSLIKTLPLHTIEKYKDHKWGFIKQYWTKGYRQFL